MGVYFGEDVYVKGVHTVPNTRSVNYIQINEKRNRRVCFWCFCINRTDSMLLLGAFWNKQAMWAEFSYQTIK